MIGLAVVVAENDATMAVYTEANLRARQHLSYEVKSVNDMKDMVDNSCLRLSDQRRLLQYFKLGRFDDAYLRVRRAANPSWHQLLALMGSECHIRAAKLLLAEAPEGPSQAYRSARIRGRSPGAGTRRMPSAPPPKAGAWA